MGSQLDRYMNAVLRVVGVCSMVVLGLGAFINILIFPDGYLHFYTHAAPFILHGGYGLVLSMVGLCVVFALSRKGLQAQRRKGLFLCAGLVLLGLLLVPFEDNTDRIPKYKILDGPGTSYGNEELTFEVVERDERFPRKEHVVCVGWLEDAASLSPREAFRRLSKERSHKNKGHSPEATLCASGMLGGRFRRPTSGPPGGSFTIRDDFEVLGKRREGSLLSFDVSYLHFLDPNTAPPAGIVYLKLLLDELPDGVDKVTVRFPQQREGGEYYCPPLPAPPLRDIEINVAEFREVSKHSEADESRGN